MVAYFLGRILSRCPTLSQKGRRQGGYQEVPRPLKSEPKEWGDRERGIFILIHVIDAFEFKMEKEITTTPKMRRVPRADVILIFSTEDVDFVVLLFRMRTMRLPKRLAEEDDTFVVGTHPGEDVQGVVARGRGRKVLTMMSVVCTVAVSKRGGMRVMMMTMNVNHQIVEMKEGIQN